jgi:hypothetical protein
LRADVALAVPPVRRVVLLDGGRRKVVWAAADLGVASDAISHVAALCNMENGRVRDVLGVSRTGV